MNSNEDEFFWENKCKAQFFKWLIDEFKDNTLTWKEFYDRISYFSNRVRTRTIITIYFATELANEFAKDNKLMELKILHKINKRYLPEIDTKNKEINDWMKYINWKDNIGYVNWNFKKFPS